jgi:multidrug efflux pump subunit AcrA (membrane-fusion protein)
VPGKIVIPNAQVRVLNPMLPGLVNVLYVAEGDQITAGQKLAEISSPAFLEAQQDYLEALSNQTMMTRNHQKNEELMEEGIISEKSYLNGQAALQEAEASLYRSYQSLHFSGLSDDEITQLKNSRVMKRTMVIPAPFDGVVLEQTVKTGEHVDEDVSLYHVGQIDPLWVEIHVPYMMRTSIEIGNKITIEGSDVESNIITIGQMVHDDDQGIIVRGLLEQGQNQFIPGQFIKAHLEQKVAQGDFYRIPTGAVIRSGDEVTLFVRDQNGFTLKPARIIADEGQSLVVDAQISSTDQIAIKGLATLKGMLEGLGSDD